MRRRAGGAGRETERDGRMAIVEELEALREQTIAQIAQAADTAALEQVRIGVLGKAGTLTGYLRQMGQIAKEERAAVGKTANEVRAAVEGALAARKEELAASELAAAIDAAAVDVTLPGRSQQVGTLDYLCKQMFGEERKTRFRAHYFPFTEPSAEVDVSCGICHGEGCRFCKGTGWLEILGCGMVDPNVLSMSGIDPEKYSGFAFGMGVERIACLKYNVPDLRMLVEGDMRFLRQF